MSNDYTALLKSAKDIPVLSTGINSTVTHESTYPTKEHPSLLTHTGKTVNTPLNSTLSARYIKVPTVRILVLIYSDLNFKLTVLW